LNVNVTLRNPLDKKNTITYYIDVFENPLSYLWYSALQELLSEHKYLEKNFCFLGFPDSQRDLIYICKELSWAVNTINNFFKGNYSINEVYSPDTLRDLNYGINHETMNILHNHFEILQGTVWNLSDYFKQADYTTKFAIRQLNNLCHEAESLILSQRKKIFDPEWVRPSQITTFLNSKRYDFPKEFKKVFDNNAYDRVLGGVYLHWTQIGKTIYEVFRDEKGADIDDTMCEAITHLRYYSGEFDIEWGKNVTYIGNAPWQKLEIDLFKKWLIKNNFDINDNEYNFGYHPIGQVALEKSFGTSDHKEIHKILSNHLDIYKISAGNIEAVYDYSWSDADYYDQQISYLKKGYDHVS